jgi:hypothetical protein
MMNRYAFECEGIDDLKELMLSVNARLAPGNSAHLMQILESVIALLTTASTQSVRFVMALSEAGSSLRYFIVSPVDFFRFPSLPVETYSS